MTFLSLSINRSPVLDNCQKSVAIFINMAMTCTMAFSFIADTSLLKVPLFKFLSLNRGKDVFLKKFCSKIVAKFSDSLNNFQAYFIFLISLNNLLQ